MATSKFRADPALVKLAAMQKVRHQYFRFTPKTARFSFIYMVVIPACVGYVAYKTDGLFDLRAKRKGDTIYER